MRSSRRGIVYVLRNLVIVPSQQWKIRLGLRALIGYQKSENIVLSNDKLSDLVHSTLYEDIDEYHDIDDSDKDPDYVYESGHSSDTEQGVSGD